MAARASTLSESLLLEARASFRRGWGRLRELQADSGAWDDCPSTTALAALALLNGEALATRSARSEAELAVRYLGRLQGGDGGISREDGEQYLSSTALGLILWSRRDLPVEPSMVERARGHLLRTQDMEPAEDSLQVGGFPAAVSGRSDLMTTHWAVEALILTDSLAFDTAAQAAEGMDSAYQAALEFVERCQMLRLPEGRGGDRVSGFFMANPGRVRDPRSANCRVRLDTLAGVKILLYRRIGSGDSRLRAALSWLDKDWQATGLEGVPEECFFETAFFVGKVASLLERRRLVGSDSAFVGWRPALAGGLLGRQRGDGGWAGESGESEELATAYALLALANLLSAP